MKYLLRKDASGISTEISIVLGSSASLSHYLILYWRSRYLASSLKIKAKGRRLKAGPRTTIVCVWSDEELPIGAASDKIRIKQEEWSLSCVCSAARRKTPISSSGKEKAPRESLMVNCGPNGPDLARVLKVQVLGPM